MRLFRLVRHHPGILLALVTTAFAAWVWVDVFSGLPGTVKPRAAGPSNGNPDYLAAGAALDEGELPNRQLPVPPGAEVEKSKPDPKKTARVLPKLKPGMTRTEVEGLVGAPVAQDIHPATITDGRIIYRASYEADLEPPSTVRPIRPTRTMTPTPAANRTLVTLEFDATKPGHPLIEVHYPDPLF